MSAVNHLPASTNPPVFAPKSLPFGLHKNALLCLSHMTQNGEVFILFLRSKSRRSFKNLRRSIRNPIPRGPALFDFHLPVGEQPSRSLSLPAVEFNAPSYP
jgi:hypothetical protein